MVSQLLPHVSTVLLQLEVSISLSLQVARNAAAQGKTVILDPSPVRPLPRPSRPWELPGFLRSWRRAVRQAHQLLEEASRTVVNVASRSASTRASAGRSETTKWIRASTDRSASRSATAMLG
jgi:hypothetical protein